MTWSNASQQGGESLMREAYKIILTPEENGSYTVFVPDFGSGTQGENLADAVHMKIWGKTFPLPGWMSLGKSGMQPTAP